MESFIIVPSGYAVDQFPKCLLAIYVFHAFFSTKYLFPKKLQTPSSILMVAPLLIPWRKCMYTVLAIPVY